MLQQRVFGSIARSRSTRHGILEQQIILIVVAVAAVTCLKERVIVAVVVSKGGRVSHVHVHVVVVARWNGVTEERRDGVL